MKALALSLSLFVFATQVHADDCRWSALTQAEQKKVLQGGQPLIKADYSRGNDFYNAKVWVAAKNPSLFDAAALYYDFRSYQDVSGAVDSVQLAEGEKMSNNPVHFDVKPGEKNPFGDLYFPHRTRVGVKKGTNAYTFTYDTITSLNLVRTFRSNLCFRKVGVSGQVLVYADTDFYGNPELPLDFPGWGPTERMGAWYYVFVNLKNKIESVRLTDAQRADFRQALSK